MEDRQGLEGVRLIEVAGGVGVAWASKLFADLGADVIRLEDDGDRVRNRPHEIHRWLNTSKRSMRRPFAASTDLVAEADIVLHDCPPAKALGQGLRYDDLAALSSSLVVGSITPFGMTGPYADYAAEELTLIHGSSWGFISPSAAQDVKLPPLKAPGHHAILNVATVAATAVLAAFDRAERTGQGEHVDFSMFAAATKMTEGAPAGASYLGSDASRLGDKAVAPWGIFRCSDGLVQVICPEQAQWEALVRVMGDPEWAHMEVFGDNGARRENSDLLHLYLSDWVANQTVTDFYRSGQVAGVCVTPVNTMADLDHDPQMEQRNFFVDSPDGLRLPGPGFRLDQDWWRLRRAAPSPGEHDGQGWIPRPASADDSIEGAPTDRPLEGIRVCDFTWIWAGPLCTQYLAHLGADVIRLESPEYPCLFRRLPFNPPDLPLTSDTSGLFHGYNSDKRSVSIDLASEKGREVVRRLIAASDVVIDNFAAGTMSRLGFSAEELGTINPDLVVASISGYGQTGPSTDYMAYGPAGGAASGLYSANGYENGPPLETGIAIGDPGSGLAAAWAVVAALTARRRTGVAARIDVAMVEAVASTLGELWMAYQANGVSPGPAANHDPVWAPHNCYPAAGVDRWVTIACPDEYSWARLCEVVDPALGMDSRFGTIEARKANEEALDEAISDWTTGLDRWEACRVLQAVGVAAFPSLSPIDLWSGDPQLKVLGMLERPDHPAVGRRVVQGIPWRLTNGANGLRRPAPLLGQHTSEVLIDLLGYPADQATLLAADTTDTTDR
ncbi:MAG: CoA transferase [Actinomycetia bacterium]|nr:CoA transferase [Actinomycetes bacterium]